MSARRSILADGTRPTSEKLLSWPEGRGVCSCVRCRYVVVAIAPEDPADAALLLDPSSAERRWLWSLLPRSGLSFSPWVESWMMGHECPVGKAD